MCGSKLFPGGSFFMVFPLVAVTWDTILIILVGCAQTAAVLDESMLGGMDDR